MRYILQVQDREVYCVLINMGRKLSLYSLGMNLQKQYKWSLDCLLEHDSFHQLAPLDVTIRRAIAQREIGRSWIQPSPAPTPHVLLEMEMTSKAMASGFLVLLLLMNGGKQLMRVVFASSSNHRTANDLFVPVSESCESLQQG